MTLLDYLDRHRAAAWALVLVLLPLVAWLDHFTGSEISFSIFYLFPVSLASWVIGKKAGLLVSFAAGVLWLLMDMISGRVYSSAHIVYWNAIVRLAFFFITGLSLSRIRSGLVQERKLSRLKSEMVSLVSHEVNNALVSISLASTLLQEDEGEAMSAGRKKFYSVLDQTHRKLARTVKTFLAKARLEAGKFTLELKRVEFRGLVREGVEALSLLAAEKNVAVWTDFPPEVIPVKCDPDAMSLVVSNLLLNAIKYTPSGGKVTIKISSEQPAAGPVKISIADTGIGIAAGDMETVFSGFYRTADGKREAQGFGIGLKASRELIEAHGSELKVKSAPGRGSTFCFSLPVWLSAP
jgi:signal transduction histidine kinase